MNENQELIDLCTNCTRTDCNGTPCGDYRAIERRIKAAQSRSRYNPDAPMPTHTQNQTCGVNTLLLVNAAIDALEELLRDPDGNQFITGRGPVEKLVEHMKRTRFERCHHFIDWNRIAKHLQEDKGDE